MKNSLKTVLMIVLLEFLLAIIINFAYASVPSNADFYINETSHYDAGTKINTTTETDRYNISSNTLEINFPYAEKDDNLVGYWRFENNANDETGANDGTVNGATYTSDGKFGGCYQFDGIDDIISVPYDASLNPSQFTASIWINPDSTTETVNRWIVGELNYEADNYKGWALQKRRSNDATNGNKLIFVMGTGSALPYIYSDNVVSTGTWQHVVVTYDGTNLKMYINGVEQTDTTTATMVANDIQDFT
ncbi:MAG: LamG domain-containing protein, partial [Candidatus Aenigmarchaeota archaeon]|nr:LamG domain-containing protein [Candidatus Aenigmarchaeota archaeon]